MSDLVAVAAFRERFGSEPEIVASAPGRVNLIGEHTDYNEGFVFPAAIDRFVTIAARRSQGGTRLISLDRRGEGTLKANAVAPGQALDRRWWDYPAGMAWAIGERVGRELPEIEAVVQSSVPLGSGLSSSAAIEMAFGVVWNELGGLGLSGKDLATLGQKCENVYVRVNCGIMDQMASALGRAGHAMFLDTRSLDVQYAKIPEEYSVVVLDTKKPRSLAGSAYNERRRQCEEGAAAMGVKSLRDATAEQLYSSEMDPVVFRRCRHVLTENRRCVDFKEALEMRDEQAIGDLMRASHESLRDDYEVSCYELDAMALAAWAAPGIVGARMTGAGFGGACVALVRSDSLDRFCADTLSAYDAETGLVGSAEACQVADGARRIGP